MLLSHKTSIKISQEYSNIIGHMCYAASKLWNVCNYERHHYKELGLEKYPDWYYQKKGNYSEGSIPRGVLACFLPKSRDIQGKMPSPKVIQNAF